jgi:hypothetical protein
VTHTQQDLINALMSAPRFGYRPPPHPLFHSLLRASAPPKPPKPTGTEMVGTAVPTPPVAVERPPAAPEAVERLGGVSMQLDIAVERRRSFWWRLVAKLQFFRS